jgi:hypothetical protein
VNFQGHPVQPTFALISAGFARPSDGSSPLNKMAMPAIWTKSRWRSRHVECVGKRPKRSSAEMPYVAKPCQTARRGRGERSYANSRVDNHDV